MSIWDRLAVHTVGGAWSASNRLLTRLPRRVRRIVGVFTLAVTIINLPLGFIEHSLTPLWVAVCANFCFITFFVSRSFVCAARAPS